MISILAEIIAGFVQDILQALLELLWAGFKAIASWLAKLVRGWHHRPSSS
jgi:hypothetical protein